MMDSRFVQGFLLDLSGIAKRIITYVDDFGDEKILILIRIILVHQIKWRDKSLKTLITFKFSR